jgi:hypothetical protein
MERHHLDERLKVYMVTHAPTGDVIYGSLLTFQTLRRGFPTADVFVFDNGSHPDCVGVIAKEAERAGASFSVLDTQTTHWDFMAQAINETPHGPVAFVDPDMCFWDCVESWAQDDALLSGRLLPRFLCPYTNTRTELRLHTSLLIVPDVQALRAAIDELKREHIDFDPFSPVQFKDGDVWRRFDTGATLYAALPENMRAFSVEQLQAYDHLFCGTHLPIVAPKLPQKWRDAFVDLHDRVKRDINALRGAWRMQDTFFSELSA